MADGTQGMDRRTTRLNQLAARILDHTDRNVTQKAADVLRMPASIYSDPAQFALEIERIFRSLPLFLGFGVEIPEPGDFKTLEIAGVPLLITRAQDGVARMFLNACRHRGTPISDQECGHASRFTCPYHGWTYLNDGQLIGLTENERFGPIDPATSNLIALPFEERAGLLFGMLKPGAAMDLDAFYGVMLDHLTYFEFDKWRLMSKRELKGANWKIAFDGYLESYHFPTAHRETLYPYFTGMMNSVYDSFGPHMGFANSTPTPEELRAIPPSERWKAVGKTYTLLNLLFPNISFSFGFGGVGQVAQILPGAKVDENRTVLYHICQTPPASDAERREREEMRDFLVKVLDDEDYDMGYRIQKGVNSGVPFNIMFGRNEPANQHFHRWVQHYVDGSDPPGDLQDAD
jgi:phenylpropionate dioxygenase-like ring-hydroxylating dioxygenase large terminal subunit